MFLEGIRVMRHLLLLLCLLTAAPTAAGPLDEKKAQAHLLAVAAGDVDAILRGYAEDAYLDWVGGPLDGRYRGKAAIREAWQKFAALNNGQPRPARLGPLVRHANPTGASFAVGAEYGGKTPVKVWHVLVYRDGELTTEVWQISPALKVGE